MKNMIFFSLLALLASGCCQEHCNREPVLYVNFNGYSAEDTDSVYIFRYQPGTQVQEDSSFRYFPATQPLSFLSVQLLPGSDYKLRLSSINREFLITEMRTENQECSCGKTDYGVVTTYKIDGALRQGPLLNLP